MTIHSTLFRETGSIEQHSGALVSLLQTCLNHNLIPTTRDQDPPHAKIASDVVSCIFLVRYYLDFLIYYEQFYSI